MLPFKEDETGQATVEYALVMVAAGAIALTLIMWATNSGMLSAFFDTVMTRITTIATS